MGPRSEGRFYPNDHLTRLEIAKLLVSMKELKLEVVNDSLFLDVSQDHPDAAYVQAAINEGLLFAYPDGTFRPDVPISKMDAFNMLNNAGIIDSDEVVIDETPIKRAEFTLLLKEMKSYERRVKWLLNWDEGYKR